MENIILIANKLKNAITNDPLYLDMLEKEKAMENNPEVMKLTYLKDEKEREYNDALRFFPKDSKEVKNAQKQLYIAKKNLEENVLVRDYLNSYSKVKEIYNFINEEIFSCLSISMCEK